MVSVNIRCCEGGMSRFVSHRNGNMFPSQDDVSHVVELRRGRCFSVFAVLVLSGEGFLGFGWCLTKERTTSGVGFEPTSPE